MIELLLLPPKYLSFLQVEANINVSLCVRKTAVVLPLGSCTFSSSNGSSFFHLEVHMLIVRQGCQEVEKLTCCRVENGKILPSRRNLAPPSHKTWLSHPAYAKENFACTPTLLSLHGLGRMKRSQTTFHQAQSSITVLKLYQDGYDPLSSPEH